MPSNKEILQYVHPAISERAIAAAEQAERTTGMPIRFVYGYRSLEFQRILFAKGRTYDPKLAKWFVTNPRQVVTRAQPQLSAHNYGLGVDICWNRRQGAYLEDFPEKDHDAAWLEWGRAVEAQGMEWGGRWRSKIIDRPHAECLFGLTIRECRDLYQNGGLTAVWLEIDRLVGMEPGAWADAVDWLEKNHDRL